MHKGVILLTEAGDREEALAKVRGFLQDYGEGHVWDWYAIGGRWQGTLAPMNKEFDEKARELVPSRDGLYYQKDVNNAQKELQKLWRSLGGKGKNPWSDHYGVPNGGGVYDVVPLKECIDVVKEWAQDPVGAGQKAEAEAREWLSGGGRISGGKSAPGVDRWDMYGYCLERAAKLYQQAFSFECNVYNTEIYSFALPDVLDGWYAVMVDLHN